MSEINPLAPLFRNALQHVEFMLGNQTFTWKGAEVICCPSGLRAGQSVELGGFMREIQLTLIVRKDHFITADSTLVTVDSVLVTMDSDMPHPVAGKKLTFRGKSYRILAAKEAATRSHYELDLGDPNK
jgi:hypothetical protein